MTENLHFRVFAQGATVVDFAYHVHTDLGNQMVAAKVNGKVVAPQHALRNAEVVEVITYDGPPNSVAMQRHRVRADRQTDGRMHRLGESRAPTLPHPVAWPGSGHGAASRQTDRQSR
jgi:sulfur carrier protein ThiS